MNDDNTLIQMLGIPPISDEEIKEQGIPNHQLWMLRIQGRIIGPFTLSQLVKQSHLNPSKFSEVEAYNMGYDIAEWAFFYDYEEFQKRTSPEEAPQLVSTDANDLFSIFHDGQKLGPYNREQIKSFLMEGKIAYNDLISSDAGSSWHKVYLFDCFDRRNTELPAKPNISLLAHDHGQAIHDKQDDTQEALVGLVQISEMNKNKVNQDILTGTNIQGSFLRNQRYFGAAAMILLFLALGSFIFTDNQNTQLNIVESPSIKNPQRKVANEKETSDNHFQKTQKNNQDKIIVPDYQPEVIRENPVIKSPFNTTNIRNPRPRPDLRKRSPKVNTKKIIEPEMYENEEVISDYPIEADRLPADDYSRDHLPKERYSEEGYPEDPYLEDRGNSEEFSDDFSREPNSETEEDIYSDDLAPVQESYQDSFSEEY